MKTKGLAKSFYQLLIVAGIVLIIASSLRCLCRHGDRRVVRNMTRQPDAWSLQIDDALENPDDEGPGEIKDHLIGALNYRDDIQDIRQAYSFAFGTSFVVLGFIGLRRERRITDLHRRLIAATENRPTD
jgi:hypothetical protein